MRAPLLCAVAAAAALAACGPSSSQIKTANEAAYQTEFPVVWSAIVEAVKFDYKNIKVEDPVNGRIETDWHLIDRASESDMPGAGANPQARADGRAGKFLRLSVKIKGGAPPFRVEIAGEAAFMNPGLAMLQPYERGAPDEPEWVQPRIDNLTVAIYERLEKYAVKATVTKSPEPPTSQPVSPWASLPDDAKTVVTALAEAARKKDAAATRAHLADTVSVAAGAMPADDVVALWSADPAPLAALAAALNAGCAVDAAGTSVDCGTPGTPPHAKLIKGATTWQLVELTH